MVPAPARRRLTSASTSCASALAAAAWASTESSTMSPAINSRSPIAGSGHHHDLARPNSSTPRPGATLPESTKNVATASSLATSGSKVASSVEDRLETQYRAGHRPAEI